MKNFMRMAACLLVLCMVITGIPHLAMAETEMTLAEILEDEIRAELPEEYASGEYDIQVQVYKVSKEYLEDMAFKNRKTNWFGYYLADIEVAMEGKKWIFTCKDGETVVEEFQPYDDTYDIALKKIAIGAGVIIICVTVSVVAGAAGATAVSMVFACSAEKAAEFGISSGVIGGAVAGVTTAWQTGDMEAAKKAAASVGSNAFMWGAISGAAIGGVSEAASLHSMTASGLTANEAALIQRQTGWSSETIRHIKSLDEARLYQQAGLKECVINGKTALVRDIDLLYQSQLGDEIVTNLERTSLGYAPIEPATGLPYQVHHVNQDPDGIFAILTTAEHQSNAGILNTPGKEGVHSILKSAWNKQRKDFWVNFAKSIGGA